VFDNSVRPRLANIRLHPIKSLDPVSVSEARIGPNGGLELDRAWALYSVDGRWVNGKRTAAMHLIRATYAPDLSSVTLSVPGDCRNIPAMTFAFPDDTEGASEWFSMYFEQVVVVRYAREGFPDDGLAPGPTIVSTASLRAVCEWFPGVTLEEARRRFRTTLEIDGAAASDGTHAASGSPLAPVFGEPESKTRDLRPRGLAEDTGPISPRNSPLSEVRSEYPGSGGEGGHNNGDRLPAFWEDRLFAESQSSVVRFRIGEVAFEGSNPCARCPVPSRDSFTGIAADASFQKRFSELRRANLPSWSPADRFDHFYRLATNTRVPSTEQGKLLRVGDRVTL
jgi:uncharacterized protein YcbX